MAKAEEDISWWKVTLFFAVLVFLAAAFIWENNSTFFRATKISMMTFVSTFTFFFVCMVISWCVVHVSTRNKRIAKETEESILNGKIAEDRRKIEEDHKALELKTSEQRIYIELMTASEKQKIDEELKALELKKKGQEVYLESLIATVEQKMEAAKSEFGIIYAEKTKGFPLIAKAYADYITYNDEQAAKELIQKNHPAIVAAEKVKEIARTKRELAIKLKILEYQMTYYEALFPWLVEFKDIDDEDLIQIQEQSTDEQEEDSARRWLTAGEYASLPTAEKYQLALERYQKNRKTKWQIGRDYERYVGYLYEQKGYHVRFHGIIEGFEDLGRDLICTIDSETCIVQCKYWAHHKTIHEKHINQLFGTAVMYAVQQSEKGSSNNIPTAPQVIKLFDEQNIKAVLITSTEVSKTAKQFANILGVEVQENFKMPTYPMIKCNINPSTGERIYHLPFDQQYDRVQCVNECECYVNHIEFCGHTEWLVK